MSINKPTLMEDFANYNPLEPKSNSSNPKRLRIVLVGLILLVLFLSFLHFWSGELVTPLLGKGSVTGVALNAGGFPLRGSILVEGTNLRTQTKADGSFLLDGVPAGRRVILVADTVSGREFEAEIISGQITNIGKVQLKSTETP